MKRIIVILLAFSVLLFPAAAIADEMPDLIEDKALPPDEAFIDYMTTYGITYDEAVESGAINNFDLEEHEEDEGYTEEASEAVFVPTAPKAVETPKKSDITVLLNGEEVSFGDVKPQIIDGRTMVPVRRVAQLLGYSVSWSAPNITIEGGGKALVMTVDKKAVSINGVETEIDVAPQIIDGRTLVPLRFMVEGLDGEVEWDGDTRTVTLGAKNLYEIAYDPSSPLEYTNTDIGFKVMLPQGFKAREYDAPPIDSATEGTAGIKFINDNYPDVVFYVMRQRNVAAINFQIVTNSHAKRYDLASQYNLTMNSNRTSISFLDNKSTSKVEFTDKSTLFTMYLDVTGYYYSADKVYYEYVISAPEGAFDANADLFNDWKESFELL